MGPVGRTGTRSHPAAPLPTRQSAPTAAPLPELLRMQRLVGNRATVAHLQRLVTTTRETAVKDTPPEAETKKSRYESKMTGIGKIPGLRHDGAVKWAQGKSPGAKYAAEYRKAQLEAAGLSVSPFESSKTLGDKFPRGPGLTAAQYSVIGELTASKSGGGQQWLSEAGLFTIPAAEQYLRDHQYQTWLRLDAANRILLAYIAFNRADMIGRPIVEATPAYRLGRSMEARHGTGVAKGQAAEDIDEDIRKEWVATLEPVDALDADTKAGIAQGGVRSPTHKNVRLGEDRVLTTQTTATTILQKVLLLLQFGLQVYDNGLQQHVDYEGSVVRALSHGGRVNIRVPQVADAKDANRLMEWLGVTTKSGKQKKHTGVFKRSFGTHHQAVGKNTAGPGTGKFREQGGKGAALNSKMGSTMLYGLNLAVGGIGQKDFNGDVILPDGAHGHLLMVWRAPTLEADGALQIGIETTGPHAKSTVGYKHDANSTEATANPESSFGGLKADKVGSGTPNTLGLLRIKKNRDKGKPDAASNARLVDLTTIQGPWLTELKKLEAAFEDFKLEAASVTEANELLVGDRDSFLDGVRPDDDTDDTDSTEDSLV